MMECDRHHEVIEKIENHEQRIRELEISRAELKQQVKDLVKSLDSLTNWIKALVVMGATSLVGFFFSYIQNLN